MILNRYLIAFWAILWFAYPALGSDHTKTVINKFNGEPDYITNLASTPITDLLGGATLETTVENLSISTVNTASQFAAAFSSISVLQLSTATLASQTAALSAATNFILLGGATSYAKQPAVAQSTAAAFSSITFILNGGVTSYAAQPATALSTSALTTAINSTAATMTTQFAAAFSSISTLQTATGTIVVRLNNLDISTAVLALQAFNTNYIQLRTTLQPGATFFVSSGTAQLFYQAGAQVLDVSASTQIKTGFLSVGSLSVGYATITPPSSGGIIAGNLGLGTTSPLVALHVASAAYFATAIGNVGIGTDSPSTKLHVYDNSGATSFRVDCNNASPCTRIMTTSPTNVRSYWGVNSNVVVGIAQSNIGESPGTFDVVGNGYDFHCGVTDYGWYQTTNVGPGAFGRTHLSRARQPAFNADFQIFDSTLAVHQGKLSLGTTTAISLFQMRGSSATLTITDSNDGSPAAGDWSGHIDFTSEDTSSSYGGRTRGRIASYHDNAFGSAQGLSFWTFPLASGVLLERMRIDSTGNVGIGTTSPATVLDVLASAASSGIRSLSSTALGSGSGGGFIAMSTAIPTAANQRLGGLFFGATNGSGGNIFGSAITGMSSEAQVVGSNQGSGIGFEVTPTGSNARSEMVRISSGGFVGIGTTIPTSPLTVKAASSHIRVTDGTKDWVLETSGNNMQFVEPGVAVQMLIQPGGNIGIGNLNPQNKLHLSSGTIFIDGNSANSLITSGNVGIGSVGPIKQLVVFSSGTETNQYGVRTIGIMNGIGGASVVKYNQIGSLAFLNGNGVSIAGITAHYSVAGDGSQCYLSFKTGNTADRAILDTNGNFAIGTTTATARFQVAGTTIPMVFGVTSTGLILSSGAAVTISGCGTGSVVNAGSSVGSGSVTIGTLPGTCSLVFTQPFINTATCILQNETVGASAVFPVSQTTSGFSVSGTIALNNVIHWHCDGN